MTKLIILSLFTLIACSEKTLSNIDSNDGGIDQNIDGSVDLGKVPVVCKEQMDCGADQKCENRVCTDPLRCDYLAESTSNVRSSFSWEDCTDQRNYEVLCMQTQTAVDCVCKVNDVQTKAFTVMAGLVPNFASVNESCGWSNPESNSDVFDEDLVTLPPGTTCESRAQCMGNQECKNKVCADHLNCSFFGSSVTVEGIITIWSDCSDERNYQLSCEERLENETIQTKCRCEVDEVETKTFEKVGLFEINYSNVNAECDWLIPKPTAF